MAQDFLFRPPAVLHSVFVPPWTQSVSLRWKPELSFYERRTELLRLMEAQGSLQAFRFGEQSIGVRLEDHAIVEVGSAGLTVTVASPKAELSGPKKAVAAILADLSPREIALWSVTAQILRPSNIPFGDLAPRSAGIAASELSPEVRQLDWAMLLDGRSTKLGFDFQVEYGVISSREAPGRLSRDFGRSRERGRLELSLGDGLNVIDLSDLPDCAFFFDWSWMAQVALGDGADTSAVNDVWDSVIGESQAFSAKIQERFEATGATVGNLEATI